MRLTLLMFAVTACLGGACTDPDDATAFKQVAVANQTPDAHDVAFGVTDFGNVLPGAMTDYRIVAHGENVVLVDGVEVWRDSLGSDNVAGKWTLLLQGSGGQLAVGVSLDE